jgi:hypothetical protein
VKDAMSTTFDDYREPPPNVGFARDDNGVREIQLDTTMRHCTSTGTHTSNPVIPPAQLGAVDAVLLNNDLYMGNFDFTGREFGAVAPNSRRSRRWGRLALDRGHSHDRAGPPGSKEKGCGSDHLTISGAGSAGSREKPICS